MAQIRLVTPFSKDYSSAFSVPSGFHSPASWLKITTDEPSPAPSAVRTALSAIPAETPKVIPIEEALGASSSHASMGLYVLTNASGCLGASMILHPDAVPALQNILHTDRITIIPSSVHELLAIRSDYPGMENPAGLMRMIQNVNASEVAPEDRLDDVPWMLHDGTLIRYAPVQQTAPSYAFHAI